MFEILGAAIVGWHVFVWVGNAIVDIRNEGYYQASLEAKEQEGHDDVGNRPKLRVVGWPDRPRRTRRRKSD